LHRVNIAERPLLSLSGGRPVTTLEDREVYSAGHNNQGTIPELREVTRSYAVESRDRRDCHRQSELSVELKPRSILLQLTFRCGCVGLRVSEACDAITSNNTSLALTAPYYRQVGDMAYHSQWDVWVGGPVDNNNHNADNVLRPSVRAANGK